MPLIRCQEDAYLDSLTTRVLRCERDGETFLAELEETILYPEGGGQPADRGRVGPARVLDVQKGEGGAVLHRLDAAVSGEVRLEVDWQRRWDHMQQHTAQHLITALALDNWGYKTIAFHLGADVCWIDLATPEVPATTVRQLEERVNREIRAARPVSWQVVAPEELEALGVRTRGLPEGHEGPVRLVAIEGIDLNTCGGTHVASTAELQVIHLLGVEKARGDSRLLYLAGDRVRRRLLEGLAREAALKDLLTCGAEDLVESVERLQAEGVEQRREKKRLGEELAGHLGTALAEESGPVVHRIREGADLPFLQTVARAVAGVRPGLLVLLAAPGAGGEGPFLLSGPAEIVREMGPAVGAILGARSGGGPPGQYQGKGTRLDRAEEAVTLLLERMG